MAKASIIVASLALLAGVHAACPPSGFVYCGRELVDAACISANELAIISSPNANVLDSLYPMDPEGGPRRQVADCVLAGQACHLSGELSVDAVCNP